MPSTARRRAMARPMPRELPVTIATFCMMHSSALVVVSRFGMSRSIAGVDIDCDLVRRWPARDVQVGIAQDALPLGSEIRISPRSIESGPASPLSNVDEPELHPIVQSSVQP